LGAQNEFFPQPVKPELILLVCGTALAEAVPFQNSVATRVFQQAFQAVMIGRTQGAAAFSKTSYCLCYRLRCRFNGPGWLAED
jgi:hypothetical protein